MRIGGNSVVSGFVRSEKQSQELESKETKVNRSELVLKELKGDGVGKFRLDDFLPKHSKHKSKVAEDRINLSTPSLSQSLGITAQQIADKIKEVMGKEYPGYEASYAPEDNTSERISSNIVSGATALFGIYAAQNKNLEGEELINSFMSTIRGGVEKGYQQARDILGEIGAFQVSGVDDAISETMRLVEVGFKSFEAQYRKDNVLAPIAEDPKTNQSDQAEAVSAQ